MGRNIRVGQTVTRTFNFAQCFGTKTIIGTVEYVHPKHGWYTVKFTTPQGVWRESYYPELKKSEEVSRKTTEKWGSVYRGE